MKIAFISTYYREEEKKDLERLKGEIESLDLKDYHYYFINNTVENRGYAAGINKGITEALKDECDLFIVHNPDISLLTITGAQLTEGAEYFDIWGGAMKQNGKMYYGGEIDPWRMSGGLTEKEPTNRFQPVDFVSGALMIIKRKVIEKMGLMDEDYFIYYEEVDYCHKALLNHFRLGIDKKLQYEHFEKSDMLNPAKQLLLAKNRFKFFWRYSSVKQKIYELFRSPLTLLEYTPLFLKTILKNKFYLNFLSLNFSAFTNKFLNFIFFIFLIRLLNTKDYGVYVLVWAHIALLAPILDMGTTTYGLTHSSQDSPKNLYSLFSLRFLLAVLTFVLTICLAFIFHYDSRVTLFILLTSFSLFTGAFSGSLLVLTSIRQKVYISAALSVLFNIFLIVTSIVVLFSTQNLVALFSVIAAFYLIDAVILFLTLNKLTSGRYFISSIVNIDFKKWLGIFKQSYIFVLIGLFSTLYFKADIFLLAKLKGDNAVGIYSAGYKFFDALLLISSSYNIIVAPVLVQLLKKGTKQVVRKINTDSVILVIVSLVVIVAMIVFAYTILPFVLKNQYAEAVKVVTITIFALPFILISSVNMNLLYVIKKSHLVLWIFIFQAIVNVLLNFFFIPHYSYIASAYITVVSEIMIAGFSFYFVRLYLKRL